MIIELPQGSFSNARHLLHEFGHYVALAALFEGQLPGMCWADRFESPRTSLLWDRVNAMLYLAGDPTDEELGQELHELFTRTIFPAATRSGYRRLFLHLTPRAWEERLGALLDGTKFSRTSILCFAGDPANAEVLKSLLPAAPAGYESARITGELLSRERTGNLEEVIHCIRACWRSIENYTRNGGIGYCLLKDDAIVSWCSTDYVIGKECDLYVETFEGHKRRGLGTFVASACLTECLERGLTAFWHCFRQNTASVRLAEKTGLARSAECAVYVVEPPGEQPPTLDGNTE